MKNATNLKNILSCLITGLMLCFSISVSHGQITTYAFSQSTETYTPITPTLVLATATANTGAASIDDVIFNVQSTAWNFPFQFNYAPVSQIYVSSNGFITFGSIAPSANGTTTGYVPISAVTAYDGCASAMGRNLNSYFITGNPSQTGELSYAVTGVTPNRKFVVQYKNFRPNSSGSTFGQVFNFQIRLCETSNNIELVYGTVAPSSVNNVQVGIRGNNNTVFLNRRVITGGNWNSSAAGVVRTDSCCYSASLFPASGLVYRFGPPPCPAPANLLATNVTLTTADLTWTVTSGGGTFNVEYGLSGFTPGTGTTISNIVGTTVSISGLTSGTNYQFYVRQNCSSSGNGFSLNTGPQNFSAGTAGEDCASAITVPVAVSQGACVSTIVTSGVSQNGPSAQQCSDGTGSLPNDDRWVKFTAPSNGKKLTIATTAGTVNDWVLQVWNGCPNSGGIVTFCADDKNDSVFMPEIILCQDQYIAGQVYYLRLWTYSNTLVGNMNLCIYESNECPIPPTNDNCSFATRLNINPPNACPASDVTLTTKYASVSGDPSACGSGSTLRDVWMVFNTGTIGDFNVNLSMGTATSLKAAIVFECNGGEIMCWNPAAGTHLVSGLNPGADYILRVWSDTTGWGTFNVCLSDVCLEPSASISGSSIICVGDTAHPAVTLSGGGPWTFVYSDGVTNYTVTTNTSPYVLDTAPTATTFYTLISVSNPTCAGTVSGNHLVNVVPKPQIFNFTPATGTVGTLLTVNGTNFTNVNMVGFNGVFGAGFTPVNNSQLTVIVPGGATTGLISVKNIGCTAYSDSPFTVLANTVSISLKLYIEGFYSNGTMPPVLDPVLKPNVCDSLELSLYGTNSPYPFIIKAGAELSTTGDVSFEFPPSIVGYSYFLAVKHRNSIETWSKNPVYVPAGGSFYNFSQ